MSLARRVATLLLGAAMVSTGCDRLASDPTDPTTAAGETSDRPRAPVVWVSGRINGVTESDFALVLGPSGEVAVRRLAQGTTRFLERTGGRWTQMEEPDALLIEAGTPACTEALLNQGVYFALRVFVGTTCGPRDLS